MPIYFLAEISTRFPSAQRKNKWVAKISEMFATFPWLLFMIYDDIAGLLKTTAVVARTGLSTVNTAWVFSSWVVFVVAFGAFFVSLATAGYLFLDFFNGWLTVDWFDGNNLAALYDLVGYTCNFKFLWACCMIYYYTICTFIALFLALKFAAFLNSHGPLFIQFVKNTIDWIFGEGL